MGGRDPERFGNVWDQGRLGRGMRLWIEWAESVRRMESRVLGYVSVSGLSVNTGLIRAGSWSRERLGPMLSVVCTAAEFLYA